MEKLFLNGENIQDKNVTDIRNSVSMTVTKGKINVLNLIRFTLTDEEVEDSTSSSASFFDRVSTPSSGVNEVVLAMTFDSNRNNYIICDSKHWVNDDSGTFNVDKYPEEMAKQMSKSVAENKNILNSSKFKDCYHLESSLVFEELIKSSSKLKELAEQTGVAYKALMGDIKKFNAGDSVDMQDFIDRYAFKKHILVQGEKGGGKTYTVDKHIRDNGYDSEFIAGHEGIESIDLLGYYVKSSSGDLVWLDGALTRAFRKAQTNKCVLFTDELLRIPSRELNIFVGALTPSSVNTYRLRTNRIVNIEDGIGETECLEIPVENLWFVGTTNVGAGYNVDEIDHALADRVRIVQKDVQEQELEAILDSYTESKFSNPDKIVEKLISLYSQMKDLVAGGELEHSPNTRHLCEIIQLSNNDSDVMQLAFDLIPTWTTSDSDGKPNKAEREIISKLIKKILK